jgi:hypothetical protein
MCENTVFDIVFYALSIARLDSWGLHSSDFEHIRARSIMIIAPCDHAMRNCRGYEIPLTDAILKKRVKKLDSVYRGRLWLEIQDLDACLAMFGALDDAWTLWDFSQSGRIPNYELHRHTVAAAVQYALDHSSDVDSSVKAADIRTRNALTERPAFGYGADWDEPPLSHTPLGMLLRARDLARPAENGEPSATELERLELLRKVLALPFAKEGATNALHENWHMAALLATDIMVRHRMPEDAVAMLRSWYDNCTRTRQNEKPYSEPEIAFGLISVTKLMTEGVLRDKSKLSTSERAGLVARIIKVASVEPAKVFPLPQDPENSLVIRTDFSDAATWESVCDAIREGGEGDLRDKRPRLTIIFVKQQIVPIDFGRPGCAELRLVFAT